MLIFNYDENGDFVGTSQADESPLEPGVYLIPARATTSPVPNVPEGKVARWNPSISTWESRDPILPPNPDVESIVYTYDPLDNGRWVGTDVTVNGVLPANSTLLVPPSTNSTVESYWNGSIWQSVEKSGEEKLAEIGFTVDELKTLLGI